MADESKSPSAGDEFQDPLENYDPKSYSDPIEQALAEESVAAIQHEPYSTISPDTKVSDAIEELARQHVACLLVAEEGRLVGVFSDRDVLDHVALEYDVVKDKPVREVMTDSPVYVYATDPSASALAVMAATGYRHVPIVDVHEQLVGIASPQRVTAFLQRFNTRPNAADSAG